MKQHNSRELRTSAFSMDFKTIAKRLKSSDQKEILQIANGKLPHSLAYMKGMVEKFIPMEHHANFYLAISAALASTAEVAMLEYAFARRAVDHEASEEGSRAKGDASRALTRQVALEKRSSNGTALTAAQLVKYVQAKREEEGLRPLREKNAEKTVGRHLEGFPY